MPIIIENINHGEIVWRCIGVAVLLMLKPRADAAMYHAKTSGKNTISILD